MFMKTETALSAIMVETMTLILVFCEFCRQRGMRNSSLLHFFKIDNYVPFVKGNEKFLVECIFTASVIIISIKSY